MSRLFLLLWVGIGGIVGTLARFGITILTEQNKPGDFPMGTFLINLTGCFIFGFVSELSATTAIMKPEMKLALTTGFAGAFTTFSTFMYENYQLTKDSQIFLALIYMSVSLIGGALLLYSGIILARLITR